MGLFRKKKKQQEITPENRENMNDSQLYESYRLKHDEYWAKIKDESADSTIERRFIVVKRFEHEDGVTTLRPSKDKDKFEEIFPQLEPDFLNLKEEDIKKKLTASQKMLEDIHKGTVKNKNIWNVKYDIFNYEAALRKKKFGKATFQTFNIHREPMFTFVRKGSTLHPQAEDIDTNTVYVPSDYKKKKSAMSVRNKEHKYSKFAGTLVSVGSAILLIVNIIMFAGNGFWSYSIMKYGDSESAMARVDMRFDQAIGVCTDSMAVQNTELVKTSGAITDITNTLKTHLVPTTVIEGQQPIDFTE